VGNADPRALSIAIAALQTYQFLGSPEGELAIVQAALYLATAPKSNALYAADGRIKETIRKTGALPVPLHIRNAPTRLMRELDYGRGYQYAHDFADAYVPQEYLPAGLTKTKYYHPTERGYEKTIKERMLYWDKLRTAKKGEVKKEEPEDHEGLPARGREE
jgi:putative ATPase